MFAHSKKMFVALAVAAAGLFAADAARAQGPHYRGRGRSLGEVIGRAVRPVITVRPTPRLTIALGDIHGHGYNHHYVDYHRIDLLANQLQRNLRGLHRMLDHTPLRTGHLKHLHDDVEKMQHHAEHIHDVAHDHGSLAHLRADVQKLDGLFHHVEDLARDIERHHHLDAQRTYLLRRHMQRVSGALHALQREIR